MEHMLQAIRVCAAVIGACAGALLGPVDGILFALLVLMAVDYLSGVLVAIKNRKLSSQVGFVGLAKKVIILLLVVVGNVLDVYVIGSGSVVRGMVIAFYLANEGLSILENAGNLGVKYPDKLRDVLAQLGEDK